MSELAFARAQAEELIKPGQGVLHSFAKPNTGEKDFAASLQEDSADSSRIRFVFEDDPVTKVPPVEMGYDPGSSSTVLLGKNRRRQSS
ncbi:MAG: lipase family protein, partial [Myxococcales bacterium]|nr:lipase family protein [Myxococcales bacterium]